MSRWTRTLVCLVGVAGVAVLLLAAFLKMPEFGGSFHPYRDLAVAAAVRRATPNVVSSVNFDQRAVDTLGEETILLASVVGAVALLRPTRQEREDRPRQAEEVLPATKLMGYLLLPVTLLLGVDVVVHGHLTAGGGFQGGVVLATGWHLLYLSGSYSALAKLRPLDWHEYAETAGAAAFAALGVAGMLGAGAFLTNLLPTGEFGALLSAGTVPLLNIAVGVEVASGVVILLAQFLEQGLLLTSNGAKERS